jgi:hypothetical protein
MWFVLRLLWKSFFAFLVSRFEETTDQRNRSHAIAMNITKRKLITIIREEIDAVIHEAGLCHDPKTGHFDDCVAGNVYSLTKKGARSSGISDDYVQRGTITKKEKRKPPKVRAKFGLNTSREKSGGRKTIGGEDINPVRMVSRYPKEYSEGVHAKKKKTVWDPNWKSAQDRKRQSSVGRPSNMSWHHGYEEMDKLARGVGLGIGVHEGRFFTIDEIDAVMHEVFSSEVVDEGSEAGDIERCRSFGYISMGEAQKRILLALNNFARAADGELNEPQG